MTCRVYVREFFIALDCDNPPDTRVHAHEQTFIGMTAKPVEFMVHQVECLLCCSVWRQMLGLGDGIQTC